MFRRTLHKEIPRDLRVMNRLRGYVILLERIRIGQRTPIVKRFQVFKVPQFLHFEHSLKALS